eukprot:m.4564 g.4564  ORF g.4564 m.4564 type:complete len:108 (+) comp2024_c1_seq1:85-408(+)
MTANTGQQGSRAAVSQQTIIKALLVHRCRGLFVPKNNAVPCWEQNTCAWDVPLDRRQTIPPTLLASITWASRDCVCVTRVRDHGNRQLTDPFNQLSYLLQPEAFDDG